MAIRATRERRSAQPANRRLMDINKDILRWVLLIGAAPIWLPFLRLLWKDFNRALADEGGILGRAPTATEAERIRREKLSDPEILVSEPWARPGERRAPRMRASETNSSSGGATRTRSNAPAPRSSTSGFRSPGPGASNPGRKRESRGGFR
jgi:hypothetical protein